MLIRYFLGILVFCTLVVASCSSKKEPTGNVKDYSVVMQKLFKCDEGLFRGVNLGMSLSQVKLLEKGLKTDEEEPNYLSYSFDFTDTLHGTWYYNFTNGMDEVGVDIFREKKKECVWLYMEIKNYFSLRFGKPKEENKLLIWYMKNQGKEGAEITLSDESSDYGYGKLTITLFPFQTAVDPKEKEADI